MDVFNVHVLSAVASMCPHQRRLVGHAIDVVRSRRRCCILQRLRCHPVVLCGGLLDGVDRRLVLADRRGLWQVLGLLACQLLGWWLVCLARRVILLMAHVLSNWLVRDDHLVRGEVCKAGLFEALANDSEMLVLRATGRHLIDFFWLRPLEREVFGVDEVVAHHVVTHNAGIAHEVLATQELFLDLLISLGHVGERR